MTLDDKIGQLTQAERAAVTADPSLVAQWRLGSVLSGGGSVPSPNTPAAWVEMVNTFQRNGSRGSARHREALRRRWRHRARDRLRRLHHRSGHHGHELGGLRPHRPVALCCRGPSARRRQRASPAGAVREALLSVLRDAAQARVVAGTAPDGWAALIAGADQVQAAGADARAGALLRVITD
jgi:hypothetical protein